MTKEEAKLVLDNARPQTKEIDRQFYDDEDLNNALDIAIKALEQQPTSDDCVSRKDVLEMFGYETAIYDLPPVTPTHRMCKDCKHYFDISKDNNIGNIYKVSYCLKHSKNVHREDFYCADFEKRGSEND